MASGSSTSSMSSSTFSKKWKVAKARLPMPTERDVFWHPVMTTPPPKNYTPGLIPILRTCLVESHSRGDIRKAVLCYEQAVFIEGELWDVSWGCGYRNFLMACAVLMVQPFVPMYFPLIDGPIPPGIQNLQKWIESAWEAGFDAEGKKQLVKLQGTRKWIGTADIWVAFSSRGIPVELADFETTKENGIQPLIDWVVSYFTPKSNPSDSGSQRSAFDALKTSSSIISTDLMPIVLQHQGHSRLVVGYEVDKRGKVNFLTFDPGLRVPKELREVALSKRLATSKPPSSQERPLKRKTRNSSTDSKTIKRTRSNSVVAVDIDSDGDSIEIVAEHNIIPANGEGVDEEVVITGYTSPGKPSSSSSTPKALKPTSAKPVPSAWKKDVSFLRISAASLAKHKQYQILSFPMTSPLTERERRRRLVPTSTKVC